MKRFSFVEFVVVLYLACCIAFGIYLALQPPGPPLKPAVFCDLPVPAHAKPIKWAPIWRHP